MPAPGRDYRTIGEVVRSLEDTYPDLTVSKIRFLEDEGLIAPERTSGGYRKFSDSDVTRIGLVLKMQRDHFLPLAVIRERLKEIDQGKTPDELRLDSPVAHAARLPLEEARTVAIEDAPRDLGLPAEFVRELARYGLVEPIATGDGAHLSGTDVEIAHAAWSLRRHGVEPRHLKMFDQFAERESDLLRQVLLPAVRLRTPEARERVLRQLEELGTSIDDLKRHLLRRAVSEAFGDVS